MSVLAYVVKDNQELFREFRTSESGLNTQEANDRLRQYGPNILSTSRTTWLDVLKRQFASPFVYLLLGAGVLSVFLGERLDGIIIFFFVLINAGLGFYQEYKSEQTLKLLNTYLSASVRVLRDGKDETVEVESLVPGDILRLVPGDKIPADIRFIETHNLVVDESVLTGESAPVTKSHTPLKKSVTELYESVNTGFLGTIVSGGHAAAVVIATGNNTEYGKVSALSTAAKKQSAFEKEISRFSTFVLVLVSFSLILLVIASLFFRPEQSIVTFVLFAIALAVSVIPEGLPVVMTFSLSLGALKLAKHKVVVKRLSAIEDLGGMEILCSDKTGTLTQNKLTVDEIFPHNSVDAVMYAHLAASHDHTERNKQNNAFETALSQRLTEEQNNRAKNYDIIAEIPFDPVRKHTTSLVRNGDGSTLIVRGAPDEIIRCCSLSSGDVTSLQDWIHAKGREGRRVLAVGIKKVTGKIPERIDTLEKDMEFVGLVSFDDPLKESTKAAILKAEQLGVQVKIITGDSPEVAGYVASAIHLIKSHEHVLTGREFEAMDEKKRIEAAGRYHVFARVTPQQKYAIIETLQKQYRVGFLGEGINDAAALKISNVALAVQGASDIAKEASDIVLLDKSLSVIVDGVHEGRAVYANTSKYILATLASNFGNFFAVAISSFFIPFLPMLPLQILLLNLLSDFPMIAVATDTVDQRDIRKPKKYNLREFASISILLGVVSSVFDFIFFGLFHTAGAATLQTSWFMGSILTELLFLFSIRTRRFFLFARRPSATIIVLTAAAGVLTLALPQIAAARTLFKFESYGADRIMLIVSVVGAYFIITETVKVLYYKHTSKNHI